MNMKKFIEPKSDQLNADDLIGSNRIIKITRVVVTDAEKQACTIWFEGDNGKPWKPCKGSGRVLVHAWGEEPKNFVGKWVELYRDPEAIYAGKKVGGIRIRAMSDIDADFEFTETISKSVRKPIKILKLKPPAAASPAPADAALITAGTDAAKHGIESYKKWFEGLTKEQKASIADKHEGWKADANKSDADEAAASTAGA